MTKTILLSSLLCSTAASAVAQEYIEFPPPVLYQHVQHSTLSAATVRIAPYPYPFPVRVYTTPPRQPYYNVPPYAVVSPY